MRPITDLNNPAHPSNCNQLIRTDRRAERLWHPKEPLPDSVESELTLQCFAEPKELCGFITTDYDIIYIPNSHNEPRHNFRIADEDLEVALVDIYDIRQSKVLGVFHTHPNNVPWPTPRDLAGWPNPELGWRYWIATAREVIEWSLT